MSEQTPDAHQEAAQKMEQQRRFSEREGITPQYSLEFSQQLQDWMRTYYESKDITFAKERVRKVATNGIAGYLNSRFDRKHADVLLSNLVAGKEPDYFEELDKNILPTYGKNGYQVTNTGDYFQVMQRGGADLEAQRPTFTTPSGKKVGVQYKEYFSFVPVGANASDTLDETKRFHEGLLEAHKKIQSIASKKGWNVPMKFCADLRQLVTELDSLILYVPNPEAGQELRKIIEDEMKQRGVRLGGSGRTRSGFDLTYPDGTEASHRMLIARATSKWIEDDFTGPRRLMSQRKEDIAQQLFTRVRTFGKMKPEALEQAARG